MVTQNDENQNIRDNVFGKVAKCHIKNVWWNDWPVFPGLSSFKNKIEEYVRFLVIKQ